MRRITVLGVALLVVFAAMFASTVFENNDVVAGPSVGRQPVHPYLVDTLYYGDYIVISEYFNWYHCLEVGDCTFKCEVGSIGFLYECYNEYEIRTIWLGDEYISTSWFDLDFAGNYCECVVKKIPHVQP